MRKNKNDIDVKGIGKFLKDLPEADYLYMRHCVQIRDLIQGQIKKYSLSKAEFCTLFQISPKKYDDFVLGNWNYSCTDMANINATFMKYEIEWLAKKVPIQVSLD